MSAEQGIHEDHRKRLKSLYLSEGLDNFAHHNILELMLFYAIPRKDTNETAHRLLEKFGSFSGVLEASVDELQTVTGMGENSAVFLKLFLDVFRIYGIDKESATSSFVNLDQIGEWLKPRFYGKRTENVILLCLDPKLSVVSCTALFEGSINAANVNFRVIAQNALRSNAAFVVLAHNHPNGIAAPSKQDLDTTRKIDEFMRTLNIIMLDHMIFADDDYVSLAQSGYIKKYIQ